MSLPDVSDAAQQLLTEYRRVGRFQWEKAVCSPESGLSSTACLGALVVAMHMDPDGWRAFPSLPTIAACMGLERSGAGRAVKELIEGG